MPTTAPSDSPAAGGAPEGTGLKDIASRFGLRYVDAVSDDMIDSSLVVRLPVDWARSHCLLPVRIDGALCVLTSDPSRVRNCEDLAILLGEELQPVATPRDEILKAIERCYFSKRDSTEDFLRDLSSNGEDGSHVQVRSDDLLQMADDAPIASLVNLILLQAVKARASDIHFEPFESTLHIRYRVDGRLYEQAAPPKHMETALVSRLKVMAHMDIAEKRLPQDGMAKVRVGEREIDIRVSTVPVAEGERVVLRLLDRSDSLLPLSSLGMSEGVLSGFRELLDLPHGLVLVTGPTGSGKTTTLYAALKELDSSSLNIMTIEDPIEYQLPAIGQMQVKPKIGLTFANGLRHILRQDPDVILVGETRDVETAETAVRCSLTGHLVFTTVHTNDAPSAVIRMIDIGVEPYLLAASLRASLAQRLVRSLCPSCRTQVVPSEKDIKGLGREVERVRGRKVWKAGSCPSCLAGYKGRVGLYELMIVDPEIQETVREGRCSLTVLREMSLAKKMSSLLADGVEKAIDGRTSLDEVVHAVGELEAN